METAAYLDSEKTARFTCPSCHKAYRKNLAVYDNVTSGSKVKCNCDCGHSFMIILDRRKDLRKPTRLSGSYVHDRHQFRGMMTVTNLSQSGAGVEINTPREIYAGDNLTLKSTLDDSRQTFVAREGVIRNKDGCHLGIEFLTRVWDSDPLFTYIHEPVKYN